MSCLRCNHSRVAVKVIVLVALVCCVLVLQRKDRFERTFTESDDVNYFVGKHSLNAGDYESISEAGDNFSDEVSKLIPEIGREQSTRDETELGGEGKKEIANLSSCPDEFEIDDADEEWFKTTFVQVSPFTERSDESANVKPSRGSRNPEKSDEVVIMTPISDVKDKLRHYFKMLCSLSYPHDKISVVLGEDSSHDHTLFEARTLASAVRPYFKRVEILHLLGNRPFSVGIDRHNKVYQKIRRKHLAMVRNQILTRGLKNATWVLWLDSDVRHIPTDLIQHLMSPKKDIVAANCLYRMSDGRTDTFDRNSWQETSASLNDLGYKSPDYLMLEGYGDTKRKYLNDLKIENELDSVEPGKSGVDNKQLSNLTRSKLKFSNSTSRRHRGDSVKLDGVGGCALLVKAELHIKGLNFPPFPYHHHIETEGFAKIAAEVYGAEIRGLPRVYVVHW